MFLPTKFNFCDDICFNSTTWFQFAQLISLELVERDWLIRLKPVKCSGQTLNFLGKNIELCVFVTRIGNVFMSDRSSLLASDGNPPMTTLRTEQEVGN
jgi:hypothetical protein